MEADFWNLADRLMQWLIVPGVVVIWWLTQRQSEIEREVLRIITILEERNVRRTEDQAANLSAIAELKAAIDKLTDKIDRMGKT
jgi:hypothetical protein